MPAPTRRLPADQSRRRLVRASAPTQSEYGKPPKDRTVEERLQYGVVNLDKPSGPSSHQVVAWLRDIFATDKVGHGGTLDPRVTGLLPTALNHATRGVVALLEAGKEYTGVLRLHADAPLDKVQAAAKDFVGSVQQVPPVRSAVRRRRRTRQVYYFEVPEMDGRDVLFRVGCEAGTYVRNLCVDLGKKLGTRGHMQQLRRTRTGAFTLADAVTLQDVRDAWTDHKEGESQPLLGMLRPHEDLFDHLAKVVVRDSAIGAICHGAPLAAPGIVAVDDPIRQGETVLVQSLKGEAVALGNAEMASQAMATATTGHAFVPQRVLMPKDTYPKAWKRTTKR